MIPSRITEVFDDGPAFIPYLTAGDPTFEESIEYVEALARGGADIIELGLPFSEPIAEGPTIQHAIARSLSGGMTPARFFEFAERLDVDVPLVCMTYYNLIYQYGQREGPEPFVERAAAAGIDGFVVPDLPAEEADPLRAACDAFDRDLIFIVAPTTPEDRLAELLERTSGYVYVQARLGVTGARSDVSEQTSSGLERLEAYDLPAAVGFGISTGEQASEIVAAGADGIIVGSALVDIVADGAETESTESTAEIAARLEEKARELAEGTAVSMQSPPRSERT
ncbi:tryptophan synthase subunit alpha [Halocatena marina]|uniref:tryptophan synthase subunit alpha n=1 Tax=Halocatena marina TaxID=2934937 RepID=UPI00200CC4A2|nr:tryptophan synthase subunit alpha [Halocatena marina]